MASRLSFQTWLTSPELWADHQLVSEILPNVSRNMLKTLCTPTLQIAANTSVASWVPKPSSTSKTSVTLSTELTMQLNCKTCWTDSSKSELNYRAFTSKTFQGGHKNTPSFCNSMKFAIEKPSIVNDLALAKKIHYKPLFFVSNRKSKYVIDRNVLPAKLFDRVRIRHEETRLFPNICIHHSFG